LFRISNRAGHPLWPSGLSDLIPGLGVSASDLKNAADVYWASQPVEDAVLRVAFQQRQKGAHEAHDHPYYEHERHAFFIFAAMIVVAKVLLDTNAEAQKAVMCQQHMDSIRDLFVRIDELQIGPYGPRTSFRLDRLAAIAARAQAIWPNCSSLLYELMNSEYLCAKAEIIEDEREAEIDAYLEGMAEDRYS
jgi:hypothetical protein